MYLVTCKSTKGVFAALRAAISRALLSKGLALAVTAAILAACRTPMVQPVRVGYIAPILAAHTMPQELGRTRCSTNNLPFVEIDSAILLDYPTNIVVRAHEQVHVDSAVATPGGCWAYMYRIAEDKGFRIQQQLAAYCAGAKIALEHNADPRRAWMYIQAAMAPDTILTAKDNCVFKSWGSQR
jgi:hypothetical protein